MKRPLVYLITRGDATDANLSSTGRQILAAVRLAVRERIALFQIREKHLSARPLFELVLEASQLTSRTSTKLLVNDRADVALAAGADGVHLTGLSMPVDVVKKRFPANFVVGTSTHTADEVRLAHELGADFAVFGPVYNTPGKGPPAGLSALAAVCRDAGQFPVIAIGGITEANCASAIEAGAAGIAGIRSFNDSATLKRICRKLGQ